MQYVFIYTCIYMYMYIIRRRGHDRMVVGCTTTCVIVVNSNPTSDEVYSIQHYVLNVFL